MLTGPALVVVLPADIAGDLAVILHDATARYRSDGTVMPGELVELAAEARRASVDLRRARALAAATFPPPASARNTAEQGFTGNDAKRRGSNRKMTACSAADRLGLTASRVRQLARSGQLPAVRTPSGWQIDEEDLARWHQDRDHAARAAGST